MCVEELGRVRTHDVGNNDKFSVSPAVENEATQEGWSPDMKATGAVNTFGLYRSGFPKFNGRRINYRAHIKIQIPGPLLQKW